MENVEIVRRIYGEWAHGNFRAGPEFFDPEIELVLSPELPDAGTYRGLDGIREYTHLFLAPWQEARIEGETFTTGPGTVVVEVHQLATGTGSGVPVEMRYFQVWSFREGAVVRIENIVDRGEAFKAAGLGQ